MKRFYDFGRDLIFGYCIICNERPIEEKLEEESGLLWKMIKKIKPEVQDKIKSAIIKIQEKNSILQIKLI